MCCALIFCRCISCLLRYKIDLVSTDNDNDNIVGSSEPCLTRAQQGDLSRKRKH